MMTDRYAVFGNPIAQSKSPFIHESFAAGCAHSIEYTKILAPLDGFARSIKEFVRAGGRGANVTAPFKLEAFALATQKSERAQIAGAANAMKFEGAEIIVDNFDGVGLVRDITANLGLPIKGKRILMLGAGGAARGAILPLLAHAPAEFMLANRHAEKARALASTFCAYGKINAVGFDEIGNDAFDLVLNATSASLTDERPNINESVFERNALAYELAYGKGLTPFLKLAQKSGVTKLADGVGMLAEQAAEAFQWWRGVRPDTQDVIAKLTVPLV